MRIPRIMICAGNSGSGKTLITCGILQALKDKGLKTAAFKCGPDYIDPMFHSKVIGARSRNLDSFFAGEQVVRHLMAANCENMDMAVMEGVMGYYDGLGGISERASAYDIARITRTPAVLIADCRGTSLSAAAHIQGFARFRPDSGIKAVILNRVSPMIYENMKKAVEENTGLKVVGYVPKITDCLLESRHLGLVMPDEIEDIREKLAKLAGILTETLDLSLLLEIAERAPDIEAAETALPEGAGFDFRTEKPVKIAVARDEAFCFMYEDNLRLLQQMGAELLFFSPIHDEKVPADADGLILYGGYPELHAEKLCANSPMKEDIYRKCSSGMPLLAECGGFMYLHRTMEDGEGRPRPAVGLIPAKAYKTDRLGRFGYISLSQKDCSFFDGEDPGLIPAHEFHYFDSEDPGDSFLAEKPAGKRSWRCIHSSPSMLAGFPHFYYWANPKVAQTFLKKCADYSDKKGTQNH